MLISLIIGKLAAGFGGTALPGLIGLSLTPTLINQIVKKNKFYSIIITGTNGKTSTARLLGAVLTESNIHFFQNHSGSNLLRGIATTLINQSDWTGKINSEWAIWEVDEAVVGEAIKALQPKIIVFTNLSRDQLDRYGEVDSLFRLWQTGLDGLPATGRILVNAADPRLKELKHQGLTYFGSAKPGAGLNYPARFQGKFNQDSLWAVEAVCRCLKLDSRLAEICAIKSPPAFGRGEVVIKNRQSYHIHLVKNPASFKAVWPLTKNYSLLIILNDNLADGTDVSWIWDVPFSRLSRRRAPVVVSGTRALDLALRLKYAGLSPKLLSVEPHLAKAFGRFRNLPGKFKYILPTYTAMRELRRFLKLPLWN